MRRHLLLACALLLGGCAAQSNVSHMANASLQPGHVAARPGSELPSMRESHDVGTFVRSNQPQLNFCYSEARRLNPSLAGAAIVSVIIAGEGDVIDFAITERSWGGAGTSEAEACIEKRVRSWKFPPAEGGDSRHYFSLVFTS